MQHECLIAFLWKGINLLWWTEVQLFMWGFFSLFKLYWLTNCVTASYKWWEKFKVTVCRKFFDNGVLTFWWWIALGCTFGLVKLKLWERKANMAQHIWNNAYGVDGNGNKKVASDDVIAVVVVNVGLVILPFCNYSTFF